MCVRPGCDRRQRSAQNAPKTPKDYVKATVTATKIEDGKQSATITITIAKDWYIYANPVKNDDFKKTQTVVNVKAKKDLANVKIEYPPGKIHEDKIMGNYSVYEEKVVIPVTVQRAAGDVSPLEVEVIFNTCSNKGVCLRRIPTRSRCPDPNFRSLQDFGSFSTGARITMPLANLIEDYLAGCEKLRTAVAGMTREQLLARPVPGKWSTLEVVCHLADFEPILATRMKCIIAEDRPTLVGVNENKLVAALAYQDRDLEEELAIIDRTRSQMGRILRKLAGVRLAARRRSQRTRPTHSRANAHECDPSYSPPPEVRPGETPALGIGQ